jgi:hypothetical protein
MPFPASAIVTYTIARIAGAFEYTPLLLLSLSADFALTIGEKQTEFPAGKIF